MIDRVGRLRAGAAARRVPLCVCGAAAIWAAAACSDAAAPHPPPPPPPPPPNEVPAPPVPVCTALEVVCSVPLPTYDGSGQLVHPDVAVFSNGFAGHEFWLAATPYPNGNANLENPSLFTDEDRRWIVPPNVHNPLVAAPPSPAHNSDPDLVFDPPANRLRLYYRLTMNNVDAVLMRSSPDGEHWSDPVTVASAKGIAIVSPAVVRTPDGTWTMWSVNAVQGGCLARSTVLERRTSLDGVRWSIPSPVHIAQQGYVLWHLDVQYIPSRHEYWALIAAYPVAAGCAADDLFFARSQDGVTWQTYPTPLVSHTDYPAYANAVYRSTFNYDVDNDAVRLWLSGAVFDHGSWVWTMATSRWRVADLLAHVSGPPAPLSGTQPVAIGPVSWNQSSADAAASDFP
ncbi:MAG TPA: hypothetical protein VGR59_12975 [Gemmatimonadaceae bacterium]|nr:hypothetical protein [Gemmatimonadaceae bacterium]